MVRDVPIKKYKVFLLYLSSPSSSFEWVQDSSYQSCHPWSLVDHVYLYVSQHRHNRLFLNITWIIVWAPKDAKKKNSRLQNVKERMYVKLLTRTLFQVDSFIFYPNHYRNAKSENVWDWQHLLSCTWKATP